MYPAHYQHQKDDPINFIQLSILFTTMNPLIKAIQIQKNLSATLNLGTVLFISNVLI